ncbi:tryptophan halogenase family protein [Sandaracinobacteroides saxicola]|uniref:Tryptophan 7-halogenase n=1 Tax=Sandaracinobacteroides saxicola TaxID=2759707 RepID=A0A7G5IFL8_9SPHN|nr:tryptophan halogenase family protein [Sandaracinobacteroides saxicola]QMW22160.1 tryptophan 7-halogenase [Sandaracinobacteroides saxicola]
MNDAPIRQIVIAGGGTAGWMAAAAFATLLPPAYRISLVESEEIGTVGVGEATIPMIRLFNQALKLDEADFMAATQGSYKLGIVFDGWRVPGERYIHAFGPVGRDLGLIPFHHYWLRAKATAGDLWDYSLNAAAAYAGRMSLDTPPANAALPGISSAFHFDAGLYAAMLRRHAEARGVTRHEGRIARLEQHSESGYATALHLQNGMRIPGDLFIDCTGFRALLIGETLGIGYQDWRHWLPCDRALAVPCEGVAAITPYTRATARDAGWQWRIPLQHRTGNGHVYCSDHLSDDEAAATLLANLDGKALADPKPLRFTTGMRNHQWSHNVISLGLSSGFMEPLESTSIHLIQSGISRLLAFLPNQAIAPAARTEFNRQSAFEFERIRDFLILHYHANERPGPFWAACRAMRIPDSLAAKIERFRATGGISREADELFTEVGWLQVLLGQGIMPTDHHPMADALNDAELADYLATLKRLIAQRVAAYPAHNALLATLRRAA